MYIIFLLVYVQAKLLIYAVIFALADLLKPTKRSSSKLCHQNDEGEKCCISRIEVQRLYLEALISPACLASSSEGCRRLTDLVCLLRYVNDFRRYGSPINLVRCICRYQRQSTGPDVGRYWLCSWIHIIETSFKYLLILTRGLFRARIFTNSADPPLLTFKKSLNKAAMPNCRQVSPLLFGRIRFDAWAAVKDASYYLVLPPFPVHPSSS